MDFEKEINSQELVLVDFYAEWCGPCKMLAPIIESLKEELKGKVHIISVDVDEEEELANNFKIYSIPTLILIKNGKAVSSSIGYKTKDQIIGWINENK